MKHLSSFILLISLWAAVLPTTAQELNCRVTINSDQISGSNKQVYETLKNSVTEFLNQTRFTSMTFAQNEKIDCSMLILVNAVEDNLYKCEMTLQSRRPVYNSIYTTPILNIKDGNFNFTYQEYDRLDFQPNAYATNLVEMLAFYAYLIIGEDSDTYQRLGGQTCFQVCEQIVTLCQTSTDGPEQTGWKAFDSNRNRYALCSNIMDEAFKEYRTFVYEYHRLGLDKMADNATNGRAKISDGIETLSKAYRARPATYVVNTFLDAKSDEIVDIFKKGTSEEKRKVYDVLVAIDPTRSDKYEILNR